MAKSEIKIREPNTLIEAGQKLSKEELILWIWSLLKAKPRDKGNELLSKEEVEKYKKRKEIPLMISEINLLELETLFPEYFGKWKSYYYKKLLKNMEKKVAFEVKLEDYIRNLKEYGYDFVIQQLDVPTNPEEVIYYGISAILSVTLKRNHTLKVVFSPYVTPLLLELKKRYTTYDFLDIINLSSKHSIVLYRLIKEKLGLKQNPFVVSIEELNKIFEVNYKSWKPIRENIIDPAIKDINENTRYKIRYQTIRRGKGGKVVEIRFFIEELKPLKGSKEFIKPLLKELVSSFQKGGENITIEEFAEVLLSLERVNPAIALWFLLHYPEGEPRLYAWEHIKITEQNFKINHPDKFLESLIKDKNPELDWLLDQRTKDLIRKELEEIAKPLLEKRKQQEKELEIKRLVEETILIAKTLSDKYKQKLKEILGVANFKEYLLELAQKKDFDKLQEIYQLVDKLSEDNWKEQFGEFQN